jgi:hypothetical protein
MGVQDDEGEFAEAGEYLYARIRESDVDSTRLRRTSKWRNPHVIAPTFITDAASYYDIKHILRLFTIERERSIQHSIHKVLLLPPSHTAPCHLSKDHLIKCNPQLLQRYRLEVIDVNRS